MLNGTHRTLLLPGEPALTRLVISALRLYSGGYTIMASAQELYAAQSTSNGVIMVRPGDVAAVALIAHNIQRSRGWVSPIPITAVMATGDVTANPSLPQLDIGGGHKAVSQVLVEVAGKLYPAEEVGAHAGRPAAAPALASDAWDQEVLEGEPFPGIPPIAVSLSSATHSRAGADPYFLIVALDDARLRTDIVEGLTVTRRPFAVLHSATWLRQVRLSTHALVLLNTGADIALHVNLLFDIVRRHRLVPSVVWSFAPEYPAQQLWALHSIVDDSGQSFVDQHTMVSGNSRTEFERFLSHIIPAGGA